MAKCPICGGTGDTTNNIPPTNEQWFCSLSTEEKAKWLAGILFAYGDRWTREDEIWIRSETWMKWLKEKHD